MGAHDDPLPLSILPDPNRERGSWASNCNMGIKFRVGSKWGRGLDMFFINLHLIQIIAGSDPDHLHLSSQSGIFFDG